MSFRRFLKSSSLWHLVKPGYPDGARLYAQRPALFSLISQKPFRGACLNAGCGEGLYCPLIESFPEVDRIENIDLSMPSGLLDRYPDPRHRVAAGSLTELPYQDGEFDCCLCTEVIEHIPDHQLAARELARVLKPGGILLASVPQTPAPWDPNHARQGYTLAEFRNLLEGAGFEVLAHRSCFFIFMRGLMAYWRDPWFRVGGSKTPYIPAPLINLLALADRHLRWGKPWDLAMLAIKR
jgi:SAM-dependent methyltransferase